MAKREKKVTLFETLLNEELMEAEDGLLNYAVLDEDKKVFIIRFDKIFNREDIAQNNVYQIYKRRFYKLSPLVIRDINLILNNNDVDIAKEYLLFKIKMSKHLEEGTDYEYKDFFDDLMKFVVKDELLEIIDAFVNETYTLNLNKVDGRINTDLQITDEVNKIVIKSAMAMRITLPIICDYLCDKKLPNEENIFYEIFRKIIILYSDGETFVLNKLLKIVRSRVFSRRYPDKVILEYIKNLKKDMDLIVDELFKSLISSIIIKLEENKSSIKFIDVVLRYKIKFIFYLNYHLVCKPLKNLGNDDDSDERDRHNEFIIMSSIDEAKVVEQRLTINNIIRDYVKVNEPDMDYVKDEMLKGKSLNEVQIAFSKIFFGNAINYNITSEKQKRSLLCIVIDTLEEEGYNEIPKILQCTLHETSPSYVSGKISTKKISMSKNFDKVLTKYASVVDVLEKDNFIKRLCLYNHLIFCDENNNIIDINEEVYYEEILKFLIR